jgi:hypothetical protein
MMAEKKTGSIVQDPETKPVVDLLTSILGEVQKQVQSNTPKPLEGEALRAVELFKEISTALTLHPRPTLTLTNDPPNGGTVILRWTSTDAQTVTIEKEVGGVKTSLGELTPASGGFKAFSGDGETKFTATAKGPCASATAFVTVTLSP